MANPTARVRPTSFTALPGRIETGYYDFRATSAEVGAPENLLRMQAVIFEALTTSEQGVFESRFRELLGSSSAHEKFLAWHDFAGLMIREIVARSSAIPAAMRVDAEAVAALHDRAAEGEVITLREWSAAAYCATGNHNSAWNNYATAAEWDATTAFDAFSRTQFVDLATAMLAAIQRRMEQ